MGKKKDIPPTTRIEIFNHVLSLTEGNILPRGSLASTARKFDVSKTAVRQIWQKGPENKKKGKTGTKTKWTDQLVSTMVKSVDWENRCTFQALSHASGVPKTTLHKKVKKGLLKKGSSYMIPTLTERHKQLRMNFAVKSLAHKNDLGLYNVSDMDHLIHIDEKWFFVDKAKKTYYHCLDEIPPARRGNRRHITKVMFLCAVARPRDNFDGKIGIWPIVQLTRAQRNSRYYRRGETRAKNLRLNKTTYKYFVLNFLIPAIKQKFPNTGGAIVIQQDNASPHNIAEDSDIIRVCNEGGWNIKLLFQPPKSPDLNVLDLGFFNSLKTLQERRVFQNMEDLIDSVGTAFEELPELKLRNIFFTLQKVHEQIILHRGDNDFKVPHMREERGDLLTANIRNICISMEATRIVDEYLNQMMVSITENMVNIAINRDRVLEEDIDSDDEVSLEGNVLATV